MLERPMILLALYISKPELGKGALSSSWAIPFVIFSKFLCFRTLLIKEIAAVPFTNAIGIISCGPLEACESASVPPNPYKKAAAAEVASAVITRGPGEANRFASSFSNSLYFSKAVSLDI